MKDTNYFEKLDLIGPKRGLYIKNNSIHKSFFGGIMTVFLSILSILAFVGFGYDLFEKRKPEIFCSREINYLNSIETKKTLFAFSPQLFGGDKLPDLERRIIPSMEYIQTKSNHTNITSVPLVKCRDTKAFIENYYDLKAYILGDLDDYYCAPENFTQPIYGKSGNQEFSLVRLNVNVCNNSTLGVKNCLPEAERNKYLDYMIVHLMYLTYSTSLSDYSAPILTLLNSDLIPVTLGTLTMEEYYLKSVKLKTDSGTILESLQIESLFSYDYNRRSNLVMPKLSQLIFTATFTVSNVKEIITRKYVKIQAVLAGAGGFIKFLLILITYLNNYLLELSFYGDLLVTSKNKYDTSINLSSVGENLRNNSIYVVRSLNHIHSIHQPKIKNLVNVNNSQMPICLNMQEDKIREIKLLKLKEHRSLNNIQPINLKNILCLCFQRTKKINLEIISKNFRKKLDVKNIYYYFKKIKFLEKILLNESQRNMEKIAIHRKIIDNLNLENGTIFKIDKKSLKKNISNYITLINEMKNCENEDSKINERILKYIGYLDN